MYRLLNNLRPRTRVKLRRWTYITAACTAGGWLTHMLMLVVGVSRFHPVAAATTTALAVVGGGLAVVFYAHQIAMRREEDRRAARKVAMKRVPRAWDAPTTVLEVVPPIVRIRSVTTYKTETYAARPDASPQDEVNRRIWADLAEMTDDVGKYRVA